MSNITAIYTKLFNQISSSESRRFVPFFNSSIKFVKIGTFMGLKGTAFFLRSGLIRPFVLLDFTEPLHFAQTGICAVCSRQSRLIKTITTFRNTLTFLITNGFLNFRRNIWQTNFLGVVAGYLNKRFTYHFSQRVLNLGYSFSRKDSSFEVSITLESGSKIGLSGKDFCKSPYILAQPKHLEIECDDFSCSLRESQLTEEKVET